MECLLFGRVSARGGLSSPLPVVSQEPSLHPPPLLLYFLLLLFFFKKGHDGACLCDPAT